jgi:8-oxo-dGTP pyrophosphatase MutT (NUDIX family)
MMTRPGRNVLRLGRLIGPSVATAALVSSSCYFVPTAAGLSFVQSPVTSRFTPQGVSLCSARSLVRLFATNGCISATPDDKSGIAAVDSEDDDWSDILPLEEGSHGSAKIIIPARSVGVDDPFERSTFGENLEATVTACRGLGKSSIWVEVPMTRSSLIETGSMHELGFRFHHAVDDKAVLNLWLRHDFESKIPEYSTHNVGVGALVINSRDEVLLVRELRRNYRPWKTPTGTSELGEHLDEAAVREVMEETGIRTKFHSILGFRQTHEMAHGRSDLFFVCRMDPIEETDENGHLIIPQPVAQECEIEAVEWVPLSEYRAMVNGENGQPGHPMMMHVLEVFDDGRLIKKEVVESVVPGRKPNAMYYPIEPREGN